MNAQIRLLLFIAVSLSAMISFGQGNCEVLKKTINQTYEGECKNGLAHGYGKASGIDQYEGYFRKGFPNGKGTYVWKSGDTYTGDWKKGKMDGKGTLHTVSGGQDTTYTGIWHNNKYEGPEIQKPEIRQKVGIDRYSIDRTGNRNRYTVDILMNGISNTSVTDFTIHSSSGIEYKRGNTYVFDDVVFPVECFLRYKTWNKLHTAQHDVIFNFIIKEPGEWSVDVYN